MAWRKEHLLRLDQISKYIEKQIREIGPSPGVQNLREAIQDLAIARIEGEDELERQRYYSGAPLSFHQAQT